MILQKGKRKRDVTLAQLHIMSFLLGKIENIGGKEILKKKLNFSKKSIFNKQENFLLNIDVKFNDM